MGVKKYGIASPLSLAGNLGIFPSLAELRTVLYSGWHRGYRIVAIMRASQARQGGSIPPTRSNELGSILRTSERYGRRHLSSGSSLARPPTPVRNTNEGGMRGTNTRRRPGLPGRSSANLAQLVEQCFRKAEVPGSIPGVGSTGERFQKEAFFCCLSRESSLEARALEDGNERLGLTVDARGP